jgi:hypothetical protein
MRPLLAAIRWAWPVPLERRGPILDEALEGFDTSAPQRLILVTRIVIAAVQASMGL